MFTRTDGKVTAEVVFDNGEIVCFHARWKDHKGRSQSNPFTACTKPRFERDFA